MLHVGKDIEGQPDKRMVLVHDGVGETFVKLSSKRLDVVAEYFEQHASQIIGDGSDVRPGYRASAADANEALSFLVGQTAYTEAKPYSKLYKPMQYRELVPVTSEVGPWADSFRYELEDGVGELDWGSEMGDDMPTVDVTYDQVVRNIAHGRIAYRYSLQELRQTAYLRRPLNERRLEKAQQAAERGFNKAAIWGVPSRNLPGLLNQSGVQQIAVGGTNGTTLTGNWDSNATPDQILADLNFGLNWVYTTMGFNFVADTIRLPVAAWQRLVSTARTSYSDVTIWKFLLTNNLSKATMDKEVKIGPLFGADVAGAATTGGAVDGSHSRAIFYINSPEFMKFHIPMPLMFQAPQLKDLHVRIPGEARCGGLEVMYKGSVLYMDKVLTAG